MRGFPVRVALIDGNVLIEGRKMGGLGGPPLAIRGAYSRVQVCDLQSTFSTQPFILSELPLTEPEPL